MNYLSVEQIELRAVEQLSVAAKMPPGEEQSAAIKSAIQLRSYAAMKRLLAPTLAPVLAVSSAKLKAQ